MPERDDLVAVEQLKTFGLVLARKMAFVAGAWVVIFFLSQWLNQGATMLFSPILGGLAGIFIGWYMAQDAAEEAGFTGMTLWVMLVLASWIPLGLVEGILNPLMHAARGWEMEFGRWMLVMSACIMSLASAVWRASADD